MKWTKSDRIETDIMDLLIKLKELNHKKKEVESEIHVLNLCLSGALEEKLKCDSEEK